MHSEEKFRMHKQVDQLYGVELCTCEVECTNNLINMAKVSVNRAFCMVLVVHSGEKLECTNNLGTTVNLRAVWHLCSLFWSSHPLLANDDNINDFNNDDNNDDNDDDSDDRDTRWRG